MSILSIAESRSLETLEFLFSEQKRLARAGWAYIAAYLIVCTGPYIYLDLYAYEKDGLYALLGLLSWALGYILFVGLMKKGGYLAGGKKTGIGTYFVLGVAIGIPVVLALVVFVLPGLYLLMRWLPAYSRALVTSDGFGNAMRWSWQNTEPFQKPLSLAMIAPLSGYGVSMGMWLGYDFFYDHFDWTAYVVAAVVWNGAMALGIAWLTTFGIAAFGMLTAQKSDLDAVFR